jgi:hypothetical protein
MLVEELRGDTTTAQLLSLVDSLMGLIGAHESTLKQQEKHHITNLPFSPVGEKVQILRNLVATGVLTFDEASKILSGEDE